MNFLKNKTLLLSIPVAFSVIAALAIGMWGLKPGIDLKGGSLLQVTYSEGRPDVEQVREVVDALNYGEIRVQPTGDRGLIVRAPDLTTEEKNALTERLASFGQLQEDQFTSVGPALGEELLRKGLLALGLVAILIILFIAFAFRHVSKPVASWKYGVIAIVALIHDILIPVGLFAALGHFKGSEVDSLFIVALLTILGISINDTIVIFDRIRENLTRNEEYRKKEEFESVVDRSIVQTISRSINTSLTVIIVLVALYILGPDTTRDFALTLIVGMIAGTYSSILLAGPLLVFWERFQKPQK